MDNDTEFETETDSLLFDQTEEEYPRGIDSDSCPPDDYDGFEHYENLYCFEPMRGPGDWQD